MENLKYYKNIILDACSPVININIIKKEFFYFHIDEYIKNGSVLDLSKVTDEMVFENKWNEMIKLGYTWINFYAAGIYENYMFIELDYRDYNINNDPNVNTFVNCSGFTFDTTGKKTIKLTDNYKNIIGRDEWIKRIKSA